MKIFTLTFFLLISFSIYANDKFAINNNILIYDTTIEGLEHQEIVYEDVQYLYKTLLENPEIDTLQLNSWGGIIEDAILMTDYIIDFELNTHVVGTCESACAYLFIAGQERSVERGSWIGFHQGYWDPEDVRYYYENAKNEKGWSNEFEFGSWIYTDTQETILRDMKFYIEREVDPLFIIKTLTATSNDMWYPRRKELEAANVINKK